MNNKKYQVIPSINKELNKYITKGKIVHKHNKTGVVYKMKCENCPSLCIRKTKRSLFMRIEEHKKDEKSVIATYCNSNNHSFDFKKVYIID